MSEREERNWVVLCHLGGLIPFYLLDIIIPLALWLIKRSSSYFVDEQGREIVNFQLSMTIYGIVLMVICFTIIGIPIAIAGLILLYIINIIAVIRGASCASKGQFFRYPLNLRLLQ